MGENEEIKYVDLEGLSHYHAKEVLEADNKYVAKETGKGLSSNDYTSAEKTKLAGIDTGAEVNVIENISVNGVAGTVAGKTASVTIPTGTIDSISVNGTAQTIDANKNVDITVPTKISDLTNDDNTVKDASYVHTDNNFTDALKTKAENAQNATQVDNAITGKGYQTASQVSSAISSAIAGVTQFDYSIVASLPATGVKGTIYLVSNSGTGTNVYDEYLWINNAWEKLGTTNVDLSGYVKEENLVAITNAEIDALFE